MKDLMKMNPHLVSVDNFSWTETGRHNIQNFSEAFGCDIIFLSLNRWLDDEITVKDLNDIVYPSNEEIEAAELEPIYLSYFMPWDGYKHHLIARRFGFKTLAHKWDREGFIEDYDQIDAPGYLVHSWMKYPKFGHARDNRCMLLSNKNGPDDPGRSCRIG